MGMFEGNRTDKNYLQKYLQEEGLEEHEADRVVRYGLESGNIAILSDGLLELDGKDFDEVDELLTYVEENTPGEEVPEDEYAIDFENVGATDGK